MDTTPAGRSGLGTGTLSAEARARLARPPVAPLDPPPADDRAAVAAWRGRIHAAWLAGDPSAAACGHREVTVAGVRCLHAGTAGSPDQPDQPDRPLLVYCHGGGYALGSPEVALPLTEALARWVDVVSVDYRLAPEHPFPAGRDDVVAVYRELARTHPGRALALGGDSAGGNLALATALAVSAAPAPVSAVPVGLVLFSPHLDHAPPADGGAGNRRSSLDDVDDRAATWLRAAYCGGTAPDDPGVSPLRADLGSLPPVLIQVGTADTLLDHGARLARAARLRGVSVTLDVWPGLWHTWQYHRDLPEAAAALEEAGRFLLARAGIPPPV